MIVTDILLDGLFAAVAAIGFGAISDPPMRAFPRIALLAAIGHALRFTLMHCSALDIATASLFAAFAIGMGSLWLGRGVRCPMTCLYIPALLPMVPGIYAYRRFSRSSCSSSRSIGLTKGCATCSSFFSMPPYR